MELKNIIPNMEKTFGTLRFAGPGRILTRREGNKDKIVSRTYNLYSPIQKADSIQVTIPAIAGEIDFPYETKVKLVDPKITAEGYKINDNGFTDYVLTAETIVKD